MLEEGSEVGAMVYYLPFTLIMLFVVLNVTIAIILEGYNQAQESRERDEKGLLADLCNYHIITQAYRGALRRMTYITPLYYIIFKPLLKVTSLWKGWAETRLEKRKTKHEIAVLVRGLETNDCMDFFELERHLDEHFPDKITSDELADLITSQKAWVSDSEVRARGLAVEEIVQHTQKGQLVSFMSEPVEHLQESLELLAKEKHDIKLKLERILKLVKAAPQQRDAM